MKSGRKGFELEPWFLHRFPARTFSLRGFFGQVFSGLRLTALVSVVSGSSALLVFNFFPVSHLMCLSGFHSCVPVPLPDTFTMDVYEINHLILNIFSFHIYLGQLVSRDRSLSGEICLA